MAYRHGAKTDWTSLNEQTRFKASKGITRAQGLRTIYTTQTCLSSRAVAPGRETDSLLDWTPSDIIGHGQDGVIIGQVRLVKLFYLLSRTYGERATGGKLRAKDLGLHLLGALLGEFRTDLLHPLGRPADVEVVVFASLRQRFLNQSCRRSATPSVRVLLKHRMTGQRA